MSVPTYFDRWPIERRLKRIAEGLFGPGDGVNTAALLFGGGTSADPLTDAQANKNFIEYRTETTDTTGDSRLMYLRHKKSGAGGYADCLRTVLDWATTSGEYGCGLHSTLQFSTTATHLISGSGAGIRATLAAGAATRALTGKLAALQVDSDIATGNTMPTVHGFIRMVNNGAVKMINAFVVPEPAAKTAAATDPFVARHADAAATHALRICDEAGTAYWIMVTTDTPGD